MRSGQNSVLPLKKLEIGKFVDLNLSQKTGRESEGYVGLTLKVFLQLIPTTFFILMDRVLYEFLSIIARHSLVSFTQEGAHNLNITVQGTGFIAGLIRSATDGFNVDEHIKVLMTNEPCLPRPSQVESWKIIQIYLLFLLNLYLIYNQVYIHRSKRSVCSYFYPKREKKRVLYLYNKMLKRRKNSFNSMVQRVKEKLKVEGRVKQERNFFQVIYVMERRHV
jgi:E3 ubiquitin-protein ligase DCST1